MDKTTIPIKFYGSELKKERKKESKMLEFKFLGEIKKKILRYCISEILIIAVYMMNFDILI